MSSYTIHSWIHFKTSLRCVSTKMLQMSWHTLTIICESLCVSNQIVSWTFNAAYLAGPAACALVGDTSIKTLIPRNIVIETFVKWAQVIWNTESMLVTWYFLKVKFLHHELDYERVAQVGNTLFTCLGLQNFNFQISSLFYTQGLNDQLHTDVTTLLCCVLGLWCSLQ